MTGEGRAREQLPRFYDDLDLTLREAWRAFIRGANDRRSAFHHPSVATVAADGRPRQRIMVLRAADEAAGTLRLHTDLRSAKIDEIAREPRVAVLGYDHGAKLQVRAEGTARLHHGDAVAAAAWASSRPMSRACYATVPAPGDRIAGGGDFTLPPSGDSDAVAAGEANFAALVIAVTMLETLYLAHAGHRRARFERVDGAWRGTWLAP
jgi:hypothetical protein